MKTMMIFKHYFAFAFLLVLTACGESGDTTAAEQIVTQEERIVSLNGTLTELLFDLGVGAQVVGVDITSTYPEATTEIPKLGHVSQLNIEAILALEPTMVIVDDSPQNQAAVQALEKAGIRIISVPFNTQLDNAWQAAKSLQVALFLPDTVIANLKQQLAKDQAKLEATLVQANMESKPKVLFIYARGTGRLMVAGQETSAAAMIELAGGTNAITEFTDFKALAPESLVNAAPDVILMFTSGLASLDGVEGLGGIAGIKETPAYQQGKVIAMDGHYLLGFGPRAGQAANELAEKLNNFQLN